MKVEAMQLGLSGRVSCNYAAQVGSAVVEKCTRGQKVCTFSTMRHKMQNGRPKVPDRAAKA